jgi:hypothetical protein
LVYAGGTGLTAVFLLIGGITLVRTLITAVFAEETKGRTPRSSRLDHSRSRKETLPCSPSSSRW